MELASVVGVIAGVLLLLGTLFAVFAGVIRYYRHRALGEAFEVAEGDVELQDAMANSFGLASGGVTQIRGNGALVCTSHEIVFVQWLPRSTLRISRSDIVRVETPRSHLGKTQGVPLLLVVFRTEQGGEDSVAFRVRHLDTWVAQLGQPIAATEPPSQRTVAARRARATMTQ